MEQLPAPTGRGVGCSGRPRCRMAIVKVATDAAFTFLFLDIRARLFIFIAFWYFRYNGYICVTKIGMEILKDAAKEFEISKLYLQNLTWKAVENASNEEKARCAKAMGCIVGLAKIGLFSIEELNETNG